MRWGAAALVLALGVVGAAELGAKEPGAKEPGGDFLGATACSRCHAEEARRWKAGPHARAAASLGSRAGQARCERCHGTEFRDGLLRMANVQCEACHGPGRSYAEEDIMRNTELSRLLGLRSPQSDFELAALCANCHVDSTRLERFDAKEAWERMGH